jgi:hypothetical protein
MNFSENHTHFYGNSPHIVLQLPCFPKPLSMYTFIKKKPEQIYHMACHTMLTQYNDPGARAALIPRK